MEIAIRMARVFGVEFALFVLVLNILSVMGIGMSDVVAIPFVIVILGTAFCFLLLVHKAK